MKPVAAMTTFRLAQRWFGPSRWRVVPALSDSGLAADGWKLAGPGRDASELSEEERTELFDLLALTRAEQNERQVAREAELLDRCPFFGPVPPVDLDVNDEAEDFDAAAAHALALEYARRLRTVLPGLGLGAPAWSTTNRRAGGLHGDQVAPEGAVSRVLLLAYGDLVRAAAKRVGVPLLSSLPYVKRKRPAVYLDDSLFNRYAKKRGDLWRLVGAVKPDKEPKTPWDLDRDEASGGEDSPVPANLERVRSALEIATHEAVARPPTIAGDFGPATEEDLALVRARPRLWKIWNERVTTDTDTSHRDWRFAVKCLRAGLEDVAIVRLLLAMPGSKSGKRGVEYAIRNVLESALRWVARPTGFEATKAAFEAAPVPARLLAAEEVPDALAAALRRADPETLLVVALPPGAGKSHATAEAIARTEGKVTVSVKTHDVAKETAQRLRERDVSVSRRFGILSVLDAEQKPECQLAEVASVLAEGGIAPGPALCRGCQFRDGCPARETRDGPRSARVVVAPHELIETAIPKERA